MLNKLGVAAAIFASFILFQNCAEDLPDLSQLSSRSLSGASSAAPGQSCQQILSEGHSRGSGTYWLDPDGPGGLESFPVYCEMDLNGGGWTLLVRNNQTTTFTEFNKSWAEYKAGFGDVASVSGMGWLGNDRIHKLTAGGVELLVATSAGNHFYAGFFVEDEAANYRLNVASTPSSADGDTFFTGHNQRAFSTPDRDNDVWVNNCATTFLSGWWYGDCYMMSVAGSNLNQVYWRDSAGANRAVNWIEMWIR